MKKLTQMVVVLSVVLFLCSSFEIRPRPYNVAAGTYEILQVPGDDSAAKENTLTGGIIISDDGTWMMLVAQKSLNTGENKQEICCGVYELKDDRIKLMKDDNEWYTGKINGDRLSLKAEQEEDDADYVFCRCSTAL